MTCATVFVLVYLWKSWWLQFLECGGYVAGKEGIGYRRLVGAPGRRGGPASFEGHTTPFESWLSWSNRGSAAQSAVPAGRRGRRHQPFTPRIYQRRPQSPTNGEYH